MNSKQEILDHLKSPEGLEELTDLAKEGHTISDIANHYGIGRGTIYDWSKRHPEIMSAISDGKKNIR